MLERKIKFFKDPRILRTPTLSRKFEEKKAHYTWGLTVHVHVSIQGTCKYNARLFTDRSKIWQPEVVVKHFENVAASRSLHRDAEAHSLLHDRDLLRLDAHAPELGRHVEDALLRHDQEISVRIIECLKINVSWNEWPHAGWKWLNLVVH